MNDENRCQYKYSGTTRDSVSGKSAVEYNLILRFVKLINIIAVCLPFAFIWMSYYSEQMLVQYYRRGNYLVIALYVVMYYLLTHLYRGFSIHVSRISEIIYAQTLAIVISNCLIFIVIWLLIFHFPNVLYMLATTAVQMAVSAMWAYAGHTWYFRKFPARPSVIIYDEFKDLDCLINQYGLDAHYNVIRKVDAERIYLSSDEKITPVRAGEICEDRNQLSMEQALENAEVVFLCSLHSHVRNQIVKFCVLNDIVSYTIPRIGDVLMSGAEKEHPFHITMLKVSRYNPTPEYILLKRFFDIFLSGIVLVILSPLMIILSLIIRSDGGTALYRQKRLTQNGRVFEILKFRSMKMDAEKDGVARLSTGEADPRITRIGRLIRKCRLDELPQLINIIKGDMSVVGPRPERPEIAAEYKEKIPEFDLRLQCKCGLTGYAQVYGKYNSTPYDKLLMDLMYIAKPSLAEDFKIIFATVKILFMKDSTEGVAEGQTTASWKHKENTDVSAAQDAEK